VEGNYFSTSFHCVSVLVTSQLSFVPVFVEGSINANVSACAR